MIGTETSPQAAVAAHRVLCKTAAGVQELQRRDTTVLPLKARWALVMVDGRTPVADMVRRLSGVGIDEAVFGLLQERGLVTPVVAGTPPPPMPEPAAHLPDAARVQELYAFFCATVRDLLGLRGTLLQLAVERADTLDDYRALRERYLGAVRKAKGEVVAQALAARLDALLAD